MARTRTVLVSRPHLVENVGVPSQGFDLQLFRPVLVGAVQPDLGVENRVRFTPLRRVGRFSALLLQHPGVAAVVYVRADPEVGVLVHLVLRGTNTDGPPADADTDRRKQIKHENTGEGFPRSAAPRLVGAWS